ncbi:MAG: DUF1080 domain-containing protein [Phycisphaerales bacterium]|jgi:hypothetical protein|nr:DUF1080 domain-containing protein [Phycisphaerales bacterium]
MKTSAMLKRSGFCVLMLAMVLNASSVFAQGAEKTAPQKTKTNNSIDLFDGKTLDGWEHYLVDPKLKMSDVWSVSDGLLVCKGKPLGYLATKKEYTSFKLVVEWRWPPGKPATNSGVLMRITGKPRGLPKCVEAQLKAGSAGDVYGFHGFNVKGTERVLSTENAFVGKLSGVKKIKGAEKKPGQWNKYEITFNKGDITVILNGQKVNQAFGCDVVAGKIGLQSEGGEVHFRTVRLTPLDAKSSKPAKAQKPGSQIAASKEIALADGKKTTIHFYKSIPESYNTKDKHPLMIFLHGAGERGDILNVVKKHGPPMLVSKGNKTPFIIISPQCPKGVYWNPSQLSKLLDHILATTKADPDRVYLTGLSMGGYGTWSWAAMEPQRFAAAIPICGGGRAKNAEKLLKLPIWAFHGDNDKVVPLARTQVMIDAIKKAKGANVKLTVYPGVGHNSWTQTYNNPEIYKWLLSHSRGK